MTGKNTIRAIAAELGMAPATVYRVLSGHGSAALETRRRVIRCARRRGYSLPTRKSGNVAVVVSGFRFFGYLGTLLKQLESALHAAGFRIQLIPESDLAVLDDRTFDGVIFLDWESGEVLKLPEKYSLPVVSLTKSNGSPPSSCSFFRKNSPSASRPTFERCATGIPRCPRQETVLPAAPPVARAGVLPEAAIQRS